MPLVEGLRGPESLRYCDLCQEYPLQLVGTFYDYDEGGRRVSSEPTEFSHIGPHCPVCIDKIEKGEVDDWPGDLAPRASVA